MANKKKQDEALAAVQAQTEEMVCRRRRAVIRLRDWAAARRWKMHWQMPAISPVRR